MKEFTRERFHTALDKGYIQPYFQPLFRSITNRITGAEALARWIDPEEGMLTPDSFIPWLEENSLIFDLDMEILRQTCAFYQELIRLGTPLNSFSVNLSRHDFSHPELFARIVSTLKEFDVPHSAIKLEITESLMLENIEAFQKLFQQFKDAGFDIWIDDFGSGYSSLNMLQNYDFDVIKIDMLFLRNLSPRGKQLLASIVYMSKALGIHTLTEGVETPEQQEFLKSIGCEVQQGFYHSRPLSREQMTTLLGQKKQETQEESCYWSHIGHLNLLSSNPLIEFSEKKEVREEDSFGSKGNSIALLECTQNSAKYVYVTAGYLDRVHELGYSSIEELESAFNNRSSDQYLMMKQLVANAIAQGTVQMVEYANKSVYYRLSAKFLARNEDKAMLALRLSTFESDKEEKTGKEMLNYGNALFSTYELVVMIQPQRNESRRIFTSLSLPTYDQEGTNSERIERFCRAEVDPLDQERYLRFMDNNTLSERVDSTPKGFIQGLFRMKWLNDRNNWYTVRVTHVPGIESTYLLTIQSIHADILKWIGVGADHHPEMLTGNR